MKILRHVRKKEGEFEGRNDFNTGAPALKFSRVHLCNLSSVVLCPGTTSRNFTVTRKNKVIRQPIASFKMLCDPIIWPIIARSTSERKYLVIRKERINIKMDNIP